MLARVDRFHPVYLYVCWGPMSLEDIEGLRAGIPQQWQRRERTATLVDVRQAQMPNAAARRALGELVASYDSQIQTYGIATCQVVSSKLIIGAARAVMWFSQAKQINGFESSLVRAADWVDGHLAREPAPFAVPEELRKLLAILDRQVAADASYNELKHLLPAGSLLVGPAEERPSP